MHDIMYSKISHLELNLFNLHYLSVGEGGGGGKGGEEGGGGKGEGGERRERDRRERIQLCSGDSVLTLLSTVQRDARFTYTIHLPSNGS